MSKKSHRVLAIVVAFMMTVSSVLPANASIQGVSEKSETAIEILEPLIVDDGQDQIPSDLPENTEDEVNTVTETEKLPMDVEETTPENEVESASEETMLEDDSDRTQSELKNPPLSDQLEGAEDEVNSEAETAKTPVNIEEIREETTPDNESEGTSEETILEDDNSNIQSDPMKNVDNDTNLETKSEELQTEARENRSDSEAEVGFRVKAPKYNLNDVSEENEEDENKDKDKEEELTERSFIVVVKYEGSELGSGSEIKNRPKEMELSLQKKLDGEENWTDIGNYVIQSSDLIEESEVQWKKTIASKLQTYEMVTEEGEEVKKAISYRVVGVNTNEYYILRDSDPVVDSDSKNWIQNLTMTYYAPQSFEVEVDFEGEQINSETERSARPKSLNLTLQSRNSESETWKNVREYKIADINLDPNQSEDNKIVWKKEIAKDLPSKVQVAEEVKDISYRVVLNYETDQYKVSVEEPSTEIKDTVFTTSQKITLEYQNPGSFDVTIHFAGDHIGEDAEVSVRPNSIPLVLQRAISTEEGEENWINIGEYTISSSDKIQDDNSVTWKKTIAHNLPEKITVNGEEKNVIYRVICSDIPSNYKIIADERNGSSQEITLNYRDTLTFDARVVLYGADLGSEDEKAERPETIVATLQSTTADAPFAENTTAIWNDVKSVTLKLPTKDQTPQGEGTGIYLDCVTPINNLPTTATVDGEEKQLHYRVVYENAYPKYEASNGIPSETRDESENIKTVSQDISMTYQSSWNYKIDLVWSVNNKGSNEHIEERNLAQTKNKPIALLTASAQKNYQAEQLEIRLPRYLYPEDKTGKIYLVGIGDEENPTEEESFTYRYDTKGTSDETDDEIVFYNYKDFNAGNNFNVQIGYEVEPLKVTDCATGTLIAKGTGQYGDMSHDIEKQSNPEKLNSREITYWYDTGAKFKNSEKTRYTGGSSIYYQGDERNDGVGANFGNYEYDPDNYNYVYFDIGTDYYNSTNAITYNQYYDLTWELDFGTETGAEVVAVNKGTLEGVEGEKGKYTVTINKKNNSDSGVAQYVLVRYPRIQTGTNESGQATYDAEYSMTGKINLEVQDQHDRNQEEDYVQMSCM